jgi:hypothetical protein
MLILLKKILLSFIKTTLNEIFNIVPESNLEPQIWKNRAILSFVGSLSKTLFGTATIDDVNILVTHINQLIKRDRQISHVLEQHGSHISSFMRLTNHRMQNNCQSLTFLSNSGSCICLYIYTLSV